VLAVDNENPVEVVEQVWSRIVHDKIQGHPEGDGKRLIDILPGLKARGFLAKIQDKTHARFHLITYDRTRKPRAFR